MFRITVKWVFRLVPIPFCILLIVLAATHSIPWVLPILAVIATPVFFVVAHKKNWYINDAVDMFDIYYEKKYASERIKYLKNNNNLNNSAVEIWKSVTPNKNALNDKVKFGIIFGGIRLLETFYMIGWVYLLSFVIYGYSLLGSNGIALHSNMLFKVAIICGAIWYNGIWILTYIKMEAKRPTKLKFGHPFACRLADFSNTLDKNSREAGGDGFNFLCWCIIAPGYFLLFVLGALTYICFSLINPNTYSVSGAMSQNYIRHVYFYGADMIQYDADVDKEYNSIQEVIANVEQRNQSYLDVGKSEMQSQIELIEKEIIEIESQKEYFSLENTKLESRLEDLHNNGGLGQHYWNCVVLKQFIDLFERELVDNTKEAVQYYNDKLLTNSVVTDDNILNNNIQTNNNSNSAFI